MLLTRGLTYSLSTAVRTSRGHSLSVHERRLTGHHELGIGLGREGLRTSDPRRVCRSVWHFAFPGTLPRCLPEPVDESAICRICAGLDKEASLLPQPFRHAAMMRAGPLPRAAEAE